MINWLNEWKNMLERKKKQRLRLKIVISVSRSKAELKLLNIVLKKIWEPKNKYTSNSCVYFLLYRKILLISVKDLVLHLGTLEYLVWIELGVQSISRSDAVHLWSLFNGSDHDIFSRIMVQLRSLLDPI